MRIALIMTTEFEKRLLKTGVQFIFPWCHRPFWIVMRITAVLPVPDLPLLIMPTKDVLNYSTTKHYNRFKMTM